MPDELEDEGVFPVLQLDETTWTQGEFFEHMMADYFAESERINESQYIWYVKPIRDEELESDFSELAARASKIGWQARLQDDRGLLLSFRPSPPSPFGRSRLIFLLFWVLSIISTIITAVWWQTRTTDWAEWSSADTWLYGFATYTVPLFSVVIMASLVQKRYASKNGMRVGGIMPLPFPIPFVQWPFGLLPFISFPRMDILNWSNRRQMAVVSLIGPVFLLIGGLSLSLIGQTFTPSTPPIYTDAPLKVTGPALLTQIFTPSYDVILLQHWAHLTLLAGQALLLFGWLALLPVPTTPGGRLLVALLGPEVGRNRHLAGGMLVASGITMILLPSWSGWLPWGALLLLISLLIWLHGGDLGLPRLAGWHPPLDAETTPRLFLGWLMLLLFLLPAAAPVMEVDEWGPKLTLDIGSRELEVTSNETGHVLVSLHSAGLQSTDWWLTIWPTTPLLGYMFNLSCGELGHGGMDRGCRSDSPLQPGEEAVLNLSYSTMDADLSAISLNIYFGGDNVIPSIQKMRFTPPGIHTNNSEWYWNKDHVNPLLSIEVVLGSSSIEGEFILSSPHWKIIEGSELNTTGGKSSHKVVAEGVAGAIFILPKNEKGLSKLDLILSETVNDTILNEWSLTVQEPPRYLSVGIGETVVSEFVNPLPWMKPGESVHLHSTDEVACRAEVQNTLPEIDEHGNSTWVMVHQPLGFMPALENNLTLSLPSEGILSHCRKEWPRDPIEEWLLSSAPYLQVGVSGNEQNTILDWLEVDLFTAHNTSEDELDGAFNLSIELLGAGEIEVTTVLHSDLNLAGEYGWRMASTSSLVVSQNQTLELPLEWSRPDVDSALALWLSWDGELQLHLASWR